MITILHGGQTGVDRGAHVAALANGWAIGGYMPSDQRDELGPIPADVAKVLTPHGTPIYAERTEANVLSANALIVIVPDAEQPRATPGTAKTIEFANARGLRSRILDRKTPLAPIARWIWVDVLMHNVLPIEGFAQTPARVMVAGPRESKWPGAQATTADLLRKLARSITEIQFPGSSRSDTRTHP